MINGKIRIRYNISYDIAVILPLLSLRQRIMLEKVIYVHGELMRGRRERENIERKKGREEGREKERKNIFFVLTFLIK